MSATVGCASEFIRGITFKPNELIAVDADDAIICMRTKNVQRDLDESDLIAVPSGLVRSDAKLLRSGDILISSANSWELVGKCSYVGELPYPATAGGFIAIVRPKKNTHPRFLYHWLNSPKTQHEVRHCGRQTTNISNLDVGRFKELPFPDFDYEKQRRIATILDKADAIHRKRQQALALADEFLKSVFLEMFGDPASNPKNWPIHALGILGDVQGGLQVTKRRDELELRRPYLRVANVYRDRLALDEIKEIGLTESELKRVVLVKGDILIVEGHGNPDEIGRCAVWNGSIHNCVHQNHLIRFRPDPTALLSEFVSHLLNSEGGRIQLISAGRTTSGLNTISTRKVKEVQVPTPPISLQEQYCDIVREYEAHCSMLVASEDQALKLFASLSQRAFQGEL